MKLALIHGHLVVDGNREYLDGTVLVEDERIVDVYPFSNKVKTDLSEYEVIDLKGSIVMPGFFDTHIHGIGGYDFSKSKARDFNEISHKLALGGTTSFFTSLCPDENIYSTLEEFNSTNDEYARFMGIHLEGPFINGDYAGVYNKRFIINPSINEANKYLSLSNNLRSITMAYEIDGAKDVGKYLRDRGIRIMLGHSGALISDLNDEYDGYTHLYNAMRPFHHRELSLVNDAFSSGKYVEIIGDGVHIDRSVLKFTLDNIDPERVILVSDSNQARMLNDGEYEFLGQKCHKEGNVMRREDGKLAGSVVSINDEMKILHKLGVSYTDLLRYSSLNAYRLYGLDRQFGSIVKGKYSDLCIMDENLNVLFTIVRGKKVYA